MDWLGLGHPPLGRMLLLGTALAAFTSLFACGTELPDDEQRGYLADGGSPESGGDAEVLGSEGPLVCPQAQSSEWLPAREIVIDEGDGAEKRGAAPVFTSDLYRSFEDQCGSCHTKGVNQGNFDVSLGTFASKVAQDSLDLMRSDDPTLGMPKSPFKKWSERAPDDPVVLFANALEEWLAAGSPADLFYPSTSNNAAFESPYRIGRRMAMQMTNLGNCIPSRSTVMDTEKGSELDARFAAMTELPKNLRDTDLTTLDSLELAKQGVVAFAPAYTLWADYAKKIRYVRVPMGTSIRFDKDTQSFQIPPNTRFYKTFMKEVTDLDGNHRYRKLETRLILSRPDDTSGAEPVHAALFGTYKWNEDETEATLQKVTYRDGTGFADDIYTYTVDERREEEIIRSAPADQASALIEAGARRHYAIPGSDRCIHCHMGAPNADFILGFTPLQLQRRPLGEGGVIEPATGSELDQIERLIRYGIISGMEDAQSITKLEDSQGARKPRNDYELKAQGYMLGNCAHCHNPRGFPSRREKVLTEALDFMPSEAGGIFQFPLEKFSPRTFRGQNLDIPVPYITPSLFDYPSPDATYKWIAVEENRALDDREAYQSLLFQAPLGQNPVTEISTKWLPLGRPLFAPWRSLIYRNVDGPFSYADDGAIFPHMPMDTPGYDCRARQHLGAWMLSIPARLKHESTTVPAYADGVELRSIAPQPYEESRFAYVAEAEQRVRRFLEGERMRDCPEKELDIIAPEVDRSTRQFSPSAKPVVVTWDSDAGIPLEEYSLAIPARPHYTKTDLRELLDWVPRRSDWQDALIEWRDPDDPHAPPPEPDAGVQEPLLWRAASVIRTVRGLDFDEEVRQFGLAEQPFGVWLPKDVCQSKLSGVRTLESFAGAERPSWMDVYRDLSDKERDDRDIAMARREPPPVPTLPFPYEPQGKVYSVGRGGQVFATVCSKCHGPEATGVSSLANTMADMTGGRTRVANLRDGLLGPPREPSTNFLTEFAKANGQFAGDSEDWTARYMVWMGLGGTLATIPRPIVDQIAVAPVLGVRRKASVLAGLSSEDSANMLSVVKGFCETVLSPGSPSASIGELPSSLGKMFIPPQGQFVRWDPGSSALHGLGLVQSNGDGLLWEDTCGFRNPLPVRVIVFQVHDPTAITKNDPANPPIPKLNYYEVEDSSLGPEAHVLNLIQRSAYPVNALVGNQHGKGVTGLSDDNTAPWCIELQGTKLAGPLEVYKAKFEAETGSPLPMCPSSLPRVGAGKIDAGFIPAGETNPAEIARLQERAFTREEKELWQARGAANAGMFVFAYLNEIAQGRRTPYPAYDRCEELPDP